MGMSMFEDLFELCLVEARNLTVECGSQEEQLTALFTVFLMTITADVYSNPDALFNEIKRVLRLVEWEEDEFTSDIFALQQKYARNIVFNSTELSNRHNWNEGANATPVEPAGNQFAVFRPTRLEPMSLRLTYQNTDHGKFEYSILDLFTSPEAYTQLRAFVFSESVRKRFVDYKSHKGMNESVWAYDSVEASRSSAGKDGGSKEFTMRAASDVSGFKGFESPPVYTAHLKATFHRRLTA